MNDFFHFELNDRVTLILRLLDLCALRNAARYLLHWHDALQRTPWLLHAGLQQSTILCQLATVHIRMSVLHTRRLWHKPNEATDNPRA